MVVIETVELELEPPAPAIPWGWSLISGLIWIGFALAVLTVQPFSITIISATVGFLILLGALAELAYAFLAPGWRWLHLTVGVVLGIVGVMAFVDPFQTFVGLSILLGWFFVLKGVVLVIMALATRRPGSMWGMVLAVGIFDLLVGIWALGYPDRSAWLLVLWIGLGALFHGIADIARAFALRKA